MFNLFIVLDQYPDELRPVQRRTGKYRLAEPKETPDRLNHWEVGEAILNFQSQRDRSLRLAQHYLVQPTA